MCIFGLSFVGRFVCCPLSECEVSLYNSLVPRPSSPISSFVRLLPFIRQERMKTCLFFLFCLANIRRGRAWEVGTRLTIYTIVQALQTFQASNGLNIMHSACPQACIVLFRTVVQGRKLEAPTMGVGLYSDNNRLWFMHILYQWCRRGGGRGGNCPPTFESGGGHCPPTFWTCLHLK